MRELNSTEIMNIGGGDLRDSVSSFLNEMEPRVGLGVMLSFVQKLKLAKPEANPAAAISYSRETLKIGAEGLILAAVGTAGMRVYHWATHLILD